MKIRIILLSFLFVIFATTVLFADDPSEQNKADTKNSYGILAGIGFTEYCFTGLHVNIDQHELGFTVGHSLWLLDSKSGEVTKGGSLYYKYHFAGKSSKTFVRPFYFQTGINYLRVDEVLYTHRVTHLLIRFGGEYNLVSADNLGLDVAIGGLILLAGSTTDKYEHISGGPLVDFGIETFPLQPSFKLNLFYRL